MRLKVFAIFVTVLAAASALLSAAQRGLPPQIFRGGVSLVTFDVTVLDDQRRPVRGLTAADFVVTEDGDIQKVGTVAEISVPAPDASGASWTREIGSDVVTNSLDSKRLVVIVMNDGGITPNGVWLAGKTAHAAIDQLGPSDLASVVHTYLGRMENFTADRTKLRAAVDAFLPQVFTEGPPLACRLKPGGSCLLDVVARVGDVLSRAPAGRKIVILVSPRTTLSGRIDTDVVSALSPIRNAFEKLQAANVTLYEFDPYGLTVKPQPPSDEIAMAEQTGGRAIAQTNAPDAEVPEVFAESSSYYLLGYESTHTRADGRFRNVRVQVTRPGLTVVTRNGYYGARSSTVRAAAPSKLAPEDEAIARSLPSGDLPISVTAAAFAGVSRRTADVVAVMKLREPVPPAGAPPARSRRVNVVMAAFDTNWKSRGVFRQAVDLTLVPGAARDSEYEVSTKLPLAPGRYELRFGTERNGAAGSAFVSIDVPDFAREPLSLSGLLVERVPSGHAATQILDGIVPIKPTTARAFSSGDRASMFLRAYQGGTRSLEPVTVTTLIKDRRGLEVASTEQILPASAFTATVPLLSSRSANYRYELPIAQLAPGEYLVRITAATNGHRVERSLRFEVRP